MDLLELLSSRVDPLTALLLLIFIARQRRPGRLLVAHLVEHHDQDERTATEFVDQVSK